MGFREARVFHSVRKTVATMLENAGVVENVAADIIGHDKPTMTYGLYSGGNSLAMTQAAMPNSLRWNRRWKTPMADDPPWTREDLVRLIAGSLRRPLPYLNSSQPEVMADSVLLHLKSPEITTSRP